MRLLAWYTAAWLFVTSAPAGTPRQILEQIDGSRLDPSPAVQVEGLNLDMGSAKLTIRSGTFFPATPVEGLPVEMVFLGDATLHIDPADNVERRQLELFTGSGVLDEPVTEAVMAICLDAATEAILRRERSEPDAQLRARAEEVFAGWRNGKERELLGVRPGILIDAIGDADYHGFFAGRFHSEDLGDFVIGVDPDSSEQFSVGKFERIDATEKEKKRTRRHLTRQQRQGRLLGVTVDDLGSFDPWMLTPLTSATGEPSPGYSAFESRHYDLDVTVDSDVETLRGTARIRLESILGHRRAVTMFLAADLRVSAVRGPGGEELFFIQEPGRAYAFLSEAPVRGATFELQVDFEGKMLVRAQRYVFLLRHTTHWYPHVGDDDRAPYTVRLSWPKRFDLVAMGRREESGRNPDGSLWERRTLDFPVDQFSFEIGKFTFQRLKAGGIHVTVAFDYVTGLQSPQWVRDQIVAVVSDSLAVFARLFGPYPLDRMTVVTVPRRYSQGLLGFSTLSSLMARDLGPLEALFGFKDRRIVIAHEMAHQWWGNVVGWRSYRDQWLSEAMADYAALLWARIRLGDVPHRGPISGWQRLLTGVTVEGRPVESIGPLILGERLDSTKADAYVPIVYDKGAVVLSTLSHVVGENLFLAAQKRIVEAAQFKLISTEEYVALMETLLSTDLDWFERQYIRGTGLPEIYYDYEVGERQGSYWPIKLTAYRRSPYRLHYRVEKLGDGAFDVRHDTLWQEVDTDTLLVVPYELTASGDTKSEGMLRLDGPETVTTIHSEHESDELWLDRDRVVFARFFNENHAPKRLALYRGHDAAAEGHPQLAEESWRETLNTAVGERSSEPLRESEGERLNIIARTALASLYLDQSRLEAAREELALARQTAKGEHKRLFDATFRLLDARIAILAGDHADALKLLKRAMRKRMLSGDGYALLAIAAKNLGDEQAFGAAMEGAERRGVDVAALR